VILHGDSAEQLRTLANASVQLVVTSPPYDNLRAYGGHSWDFEGTARELFRVLCDGGVMCWNVNDAVVDGSETLTSAKQKIFFREECGFRIHDTMIYEKNNFSHPETRRYHSMFEYVFILSKNAPATFNPIMDKPNATAGMRSFGTATFARPDGSRFERATQGTISADFGMRGNVWRGRTRGQEEVCESKPHPAMMPKWLARDLILSWSNPCDTVLDPFAGSFTTCIAALELGRSTIGIEIHEPYVELGRRTLSNVTPGFEFPSVLNGSEERLVAPVSQESLL
jgi:DNA modification methylase